MLCIWWDRRGPIHWELMEQGQTITAEVYCEQLKRVRRKLRNRRIPVVFLQDNARPHVAHRTQQKLVQLGWKVLEHPAYSTDLSPTDFHLFRGLEHWIRGKSFENSEEVEQSLSEFFASRDRVWYRHGIHQLEDSWEKVIESEGDYVE